MTTPLNEDALRALVREAIGRIESRAGQDQVSRAPQLIHLSASNYQYSLPPSGGPCFIEPGVRCNHCGYCQVHGH
jgi:hypothetical protein